MYIKKIVIKNQLEKKLRQGFVKKSQCKRLCSIEQPQSYILVQQLVLI